MSKKITIYNVPVIQNELTFKTPEDFQQWKEEEMKTNTSYVCFSGARVRNHVRYQYYYCNSSGTYNPKGDKKRLLKLQGSNKVGIYCTADMIVKQTQSAIKVTHCSTHFNHTIQLAHINLPEAVRLNVASKLQQGVKIS